MFTSEKQGFQTHGNFTLSKRRNLQGLCLNYVIYFVANIIHHLWPETR